MTKLRSIIFLTLACSTISNHSYGMYWTGNLPKEFAYLKSISLNKKELEEILQLEEKEFEKKFTEDLHHFRGNINCVITDPFTDPEAANIPRVNYPYNPTLLNIIAVHLVTNSNYTLFMRKNVFFNLANAAIIVIKKTNVDPNISYLKEKSTGNVFQMLCQKITLLLQEIQDNQQLTNNQIFFYYKMITKIQEIIDALIEKGANPSIRANYPRLTNDTTTLITPVQLLFSATPHTKEAADLLLGIIKKLLAAERRFGGANKFLSYCKEDIKQNKSAIPYFYEELFKIFDEIHTTPTTESPFDDAKIITDDNL